MTIKFTVSPAWLLAVVPPVVLYLYFYLRNVDNLVNILAIIGSVGMGILGIFIVLMRHKIVKILKAGDKDDVVAGIDSQEIKIRKTGNNYFNRHHFSRLIRYLEYRFQAVNPVAVKPPRGIIKHANKKSHICQ